MLRIFAAALFAAIVGTTGVAQAATVTGSYTGSLISVDPMLAGDFAAGNAITFAFSYDDTTPDSLFYPPGGIDWFPNNGVYQNAGTGSVTVGGYTASGPLFLDVTDDMANDGFTLALNSLAGSPLSNGLVPGQASLNLTALSTLFSSDHLPSSYVAASLFMLRSFQFTFYGPGFTPYSMTGTIDGPSVATTPLPAAFPLFASALLGLGFAGWRRRKSAPAAA